ncbi:MAG: hypothetical protein WCJ55_05185 [Chloroflexales bacterium]
MTVQPLSANALRNLLHADYRRITLLATWAMMACYVLCDLLLRWGQTSGASILIWFAKWLSAGRLQEISIFGTGYFCIWVVFYLLDDAFEQAGRRSWCYRFGDLAHSQIFNSICIGALLALLGVALAYGVAAISFWLLAGLLLLAYLLNALMGNTALQQRIARYKMRLRLLLRRLPLIGRFVSVQPINARLAATMAQTQAAAQPAPPNPGQHQP